MIDYKSDSMPYLTVVFTPENDAIIRRVDEALHEFGLHAFLTSGAEGVHRHASKHFNNAAVDFRIVWTEAQAPAVLERIKQKLPPGFRLLRETLHLHVERATVPDNLGV